MQSILNSAPRLGKSHKIASALSLLGIFKALHREKAVLSPSCVNHSRNRYHQHLWKPLLLKVINLCLFCNWRLPWVVEGWCKTSSQDRNAYSSVFLLVRNTTKWKVALPTAVCQCRSVLQWIFHLLPLLLYRHCSSPGWFPNMTDWVDRATPPQRWGTTLQVHSPLRNRGAHVYLNKKHVTLGAAGSVVTAHSSITPHLQVQDVFFFYNSAHRLLSIQRREAGLPWWSPNILYSLIMADNLNTTLLHKTQFHYLLMKAFPNDASDRLHLCSCSNLPENEVFHLTLTD